MTTCVHCGTEFSAKHEEDRYCCRGCEYVAELISEEGWEQFYDLKGDAAVAPVRSRPFEDHDFSWVKPMVEEAERKAGAGDTAGFDLGLEGISCVGCVWLIERLFAQHQGSVRVAAHPASGRMHIEWVCGKCDVEGFLKDLSRFGYVAAETVSGGGDGERRKLAVRFGLCGGFALNTMAFSLPWYLGMTGDFEFAGLFRMVAFVSATLSMCVGAGYFIVRAWRSLKVGSVHIDMPIALGLMAAYAGSIFGWAVDSEHLVYFDFVSTFVFLMLGGRYLQTMAVDRNRRRLIARQPVSETYEGEDESSPVVLREKLSAGMRFRLGSGHVMPVSGILSSGEADFSFAWIHGEADPVRVAQGARLPAGAILLGRDTVVVEAGESWAESLLFRLTAPSETERGTPGLDRLLRVYLLAVLVLGVAAFVGWGMYGEWLLGMQAMISVFVVSCPCALGVAIPLADDLAASAVGRQGVFVRTATLWSRLVRVRHVVFDKTGTLTLERPVLINPEVVYALEDRAALALARLTRGSLHPMSRTLLEAMGGRGQKLLVGVGADESIREYPGLGVVLRSETGEWSLGKAGWTGQEESVAGAVEEGSELRRGGQLVARFQFRDELRPGAVSVVRWLRERGLDLHIFSGDQQAKVDQIAQPLGIAKNQAIGGLNPLEKEERMRALGGTSSLFLGDGANDSLAFDVAYVAGTPVVDRSVLESKADFYTLGSGLSFLPCLLETARSRVHAVRQAFGFALVYNLTTVAYSMAGQMSPLVAAILMPLSSVVTIVIVAACFSNKSTIKG
jgi:Cu2+-exporting ATPase